MSPNYKRKRRFSRGDVRENKFDNVNSDIEDGDERILDAAELKEFVQDELDTRNEEDEHNGSDSDSNNSKKIKITPFNLNEELEDGAFTASGTFLFKKEKELDAWVDSVDWSALKKEKKINSTQKTPSTSESTSNSHAELVIDNKDAVNNRVYCIKQMLRIMKPNETIQKTIKRLGDQVRGQQKLRAKKHNQTPQDNSSEIPNLEEIKRKLDVMIECAHKCVEDGDFDVYSRTFDELEECINT